MSTNKANWAVAIANYAKTTDNTLTLMTGEKLFNVIVDPNDTNWSSGTNSHGDCGYFPSTHVQMTQQRPNAVAHTPSAPTTNFVDELPENWTTKKSSDGRTYYVNMITHATQWTKPTEPASREEGRKSESELLPGWSRKTSNKTGKTYYHNQTTNETTWTHPGTSSDRPQPPSLAVSPPPPAGRSSVTFSSSVGLPPSPSRSGLSDGEVWKQAYNLVTKRKMMKKKLGYESKYQERFIFLKADLSEFCWAKPNGKENVYKGVPFEEIISVEIGLPNRFKDKKLPEGFKTACFSIKHKSGVIDLYIDEATEQDGFDVASTSPETKCSQYADALRKLVFGLKSSSWSPKDFLASFSERSRGSIAKMGGENERGSTGSRRSSTTTMMSPMYKRQSMSTYAAGAFSKKNTKWSKYHSVQLTPREMVSWASVPTKVALNNMSTPNLSKQAIDLFKMVCACMGEDGKGGVIAEPKVKRDMVISVAAEHQELIDEVFCQLVKQTSGNPNFESERRGWQMLTACAAKFVPNRSLCECVCNHANRRRFRNDKIGGLSFFVFQRIMLYAGGKAEEDSLEPIDIGDDDIEDIENCFVPESVWGQTLEATLRKELFTRNPSSTMPPPGSLAFDHSSGVPVIMSLLTTAVIQLGGESTEGIFREASNNDDLSYYREQIMGGDYRSITLGGESDVPVVDNVHVAADLLKSWLRGMTEPLFPPEMYEACVEAGRAKTSQKARSLLKKLEPANRACVEHLCVFLKNLARYTESTRMDESNFALVFHPNMLRNPGNDPMIFQQNSEYQRRFIHYLISDVSSGE
ncbi:hypothetical protein TrLO_g553 [Triparma laevis f. longispina]|uniref:Rho GTPase activating protein n=1 Tax=Triparma laevis f. longispina TaxID=1714387 RepID=A0A9W7AQN3_9STRA|nr:hypothetical protein TrLO_g553 [Triparma laevis f. longispina]